jgi:methylamine dehydrogenase heavy chain
MRLANRVLSSERGQMLLGTALALAMLVTVPATAQQQPADTGRDRAGAQVPSQVTEEVTADVEDVPEILQAPPPDPRRVYVADPADFAIANQIFTIDGNQAKLITITDAGLVTNPAVPSDGSFLALASTVYSRVAHGERDDYVEIYDPRTFKIIADIDIPERRFLVNVYPSMTEITPDNKYLLFYQFTPSPGVGLVDIAAKKFVKMMDIPDCYYLFPTGERQFFMHCREGALLKATFQPDGSIQTEKTKVFHSEDEYLINTPAFSRKAGKIVWPSYDGTIYRIDISGGEAKFSEPFEAFTEQEKSQGWAPGGWLQVAYHRESDRIYLLADQRAKWTHKYPSRTVFVYDGQSGKRLDRFDLGHEVNSIAVSQDAEPQLYALSAPDRKLYIYDTKTKKETGSVGDLGRVPIIVMTADS